MLFNDTHIDIKEYWTKAAILWQVVERVLYELKGKEKNNSLLLIRDSNILRNLEGTFSERRWEMRVDILTESKASRMSMNEATKILYY